MVMDFSSLPYFTFWALVSIAFSIATTYALSHTTILGLDMIEYFFLLSVNCCISYALLYLPGLALDQVGISFPVISSFALWQSLSSPILHIIVWSWIGITYLITGTHGLGLTIHLPDPALYTFVIFTSFSTYYGHLFPLRLPMIQVRRRRRFDFQVLIHLITMYAPLIYLASISYTKLAPDNWISEVVMLTLFPAACSLSNAVVLVPLFTSFRYYWTQGLMLSVGAVVPLKLFPYHFLCWIMMQCLFAALFRVCHKLHFLRASQTGFISYSIVIPGFYSLCASLFEGLVAKTSIVAKAYQQRRIVEIVCGMFGNAVAQYYIRDPSQALLLACLFMAVACLGNIANVNPATDFGIFQFFVSAALQCAVSLYGLHFYTFLVVVVGTALMVLRWKMESVLLSHFDHDFISLIRYRPWQQRGLKETRIPIFNSK